jgi:haloacetate dehalogenase
MEKKLSKPGIGLGFFDPEAFAEYVRCFNWKTIKGSCADYRACPTATTTSTRPTSRRSHTEGVHGDGLSMWQRNYATNAWGGALPCGHYVPEETLQWLLCHFKQD